MAKTNFTLLELLYEALRSPYGVAVETNNAERLRHKLYPLRKEDEALACLSFVISPFNGRDLWILKREPSNEEGE